jgi:type II secretory pathway component GspD/PulD (secretin)
LHRQRNTQRCLQLPGQGVYHLRLARSITLCLMSGVVCLFLFAMVETCHAKEADSTTTVTEAAAVTEAATGDSEVTAQRRKAQEWLDIAKTALSRGMYDQAGEVLGYCTDIKDSLSDKQKKRLASYSQEVTAGLDGQKQAEAAIKKADEYLASQKLVDAEQELKKAYEYRKYLTEPTVEKIKDKLGAVSEQKSRTKKRMQALFKKSSQFYRDGLLDRAAIGFSEIKESKIPLSFFDRGGDLTDVDGYLKKIAERSGYVSEATVATTASAGSQNKSAADGTSGKTAVQESAAEDVSIEKSGGTADTSAAKSVDANEMPTVTDATTAPTNKEPEQVVAQQPETEQPDQDIDNAVTVEKVKTDKSWWPFGGGKKTREINPEQRKTIEGLMAEADVAMQKGYYSQAQQYFQQVLAIDPEMQSAKEGLAAANYNLTQPQVTPVTDKPSILQRVKEQEMLRIQAVEAMWTSARSEISQLQSQGKFTEAHAEISRVLTNIEGNKQVLGPDRYSNMKNEAQGLLSQIDQQEVQSQQSELEEKIGEAKLKEITRQNKAQSERQRKIDELFELAQKFKESREFDKGIATLERLLSIDAENKYALWLKKDLEDLQFFAQQRDTARVADQEGLKVLADADAAATPWLDRLRFGDEWLEMTERRRAAEDKGSQKKDRVMAKLKEQLLDLNHDDVPLQEVIDNIRTITGLNIVPAWNELNNATITPEEMVTIRVEQIPAGKALDLVLAYVSGGKQLGRAGYEVDDEGIISIKLVSETYGYYLETYYVADLVEQQSNSSDEYGGGGGGSYGGNSGGGSSRNSGGSSGRNSGRGGSSSSGRGGGYSGIMDQNPNNNIDSGNVTYASDQDQGDTNRSPSGRNQMRPDFVQYGGGSSGGRSGGRSSGGGRSGGRNSSSGGGYGGGGGMSGGMGGEMGGGYEEEELRWLIQSTIEPDSWNDSSGYGGGMGGGMGGGRNQRGGMSTTTGMSIVGEGRGELNFYRQKYMTVFHTLKIHRQIKDLLKKLRETLGDQVAIESRLLTISSNFLEDIGLDADFLINMNNAGFDKFSNINVNQGSSTFTETPSTSVPGTLGGGATPSAFSMGGTFLDNVQVDFLIRATQANKRNKALVAPHVTVFNGEEASVVFRTYTNYVSQITSNVSFAAVGYDATTSEANTGIEMYITPTISADRRFVMLQVEFTQEITRSITPFTISEGTPEHVVDGTTVPATQTVRIQLPEVDENEIMTHVSVPDGGTLLLGGQKIVGELEVESGVPGLSKIPILNRLFSNRSMVKDESVLLILIKPEIILMNEREELQFGSLIPQK